VKKTTTKNLKGGDTIAEESSEDEKGQGGGGSPGKCTLTKKSTCGNRDVSFPG